MSARVAASGALLLMALSACGSSALVEAASAGDRPRLRQGLAARASGDPVDLDEARRVARRMIQRDLVTAKSPTGAVRFDHLDGCAAAVPHALEERARSQDAIAARAARWRVAAGLVANRHYRHHVASRHDGWRAAAARGLNEAAPRPDALAHEGREKAGRWRRRLIADGAREVRHAALEAAVEARDLADVQVLLEAARVDPDPDARRMAIAALGAVGDRAAVVGLIDLWERADEATRVAIVQAWGTAAGRPAETESALDCGKDAGSPACAAIEQLDRAASGPVASMSSAVAAGELLHLTVAVPEAVRERAGAALERAIDDGAAAPVRVEAIGTAPLARAHLVAAIEDARKAADPRVVVAAHARLVSVPAARNASLDALVAHAAKTGPAADAAKDALAAAGDARVLPHLERDAAAKSVGTRGATAKRLVRLGRYGKALGLVADDDQRVRVTAACAILVAEDE